MFPCYCTGEYKPVKAVLKTCFPFCFHPCAGNVLTQFDSKQHSSCKLELHSSAILLLVFPPFVKSFLQTKVDETQIPRIREGMTSVFLHKYSSSWLMWQSTCLFLTKSIHYILTIKWVLEMISINYSRTDNRGIPCRADTLSLKKFILKK